MHAKCACSLKGLVVPSQISAGPGRKFVFFIYTYIFKYTKCFLNILCPCVCAPCTDSTYLKWFLGFSGYPACISVVLIFFPLPQDGNDSKPWFCRPQNDSFKLFWKIARWQIVFFHENPCNNFCVPSHFQCLKNMVRSQTNSDVEWHSCCKYES